MTIAPDLLARVFAFVADDPDRDTAREALDLVANDDQAALADRFDGRLEFGTAGLRGVIGAGPNRMNRAVVRKTTAGLCAYLLRTVPHAHARGLVIARDGRRLSDVFARDAARVATGMGFLVHFFEEPTPTPVCAFAVKDLGAAAGVMITASHNPPEYNGYKVYWGNAAQIVPPHDRGIAQAIDAIASVKDLALVDREAGRLMGLYLPVLADVEERYCQAVQALDFGLAKDRSLSIAYTPLHGVGGRFAQRVLRDAGFENVFVVDRQAEPDAAFPTVRFPNPEEPGAMDLVLALAREKQADLVIANDPDADRIAVGYRSRGGEYLLLSGNDVGTLLGHHRLVEDPRPPKNPLVVTTVVSSPMLGHLAATLGARYEETLTGFKWIANRAIELEAKGEAAFVFGYEEALGATVGDVVRDKDGIGSAVVVALLAAFLKTRGQTLGDRLDEIARRFGIYVSRQHNEALPGASGAAAIRAMMEGLRSRPPKALGVTEVLSVRDFLAGEKRFADGRTEALTLPKSNVLTFDLEGGDRIVARPSGTEPKIKFYFDVRVTPGHGESLDDARARGKAKLQAIQDAFLAVAHQG